MRQNSAISRRTKLQLLATTGLISMSVLVAGSTDRAFAQSATPASQPEEVVVTGSRIQQSGFTTPTPVMVTTPEELTATAPLVSEGLNALPDISVGSQRTGGIGTGGSGQAIITIRALGATRTLVLLDGRRYTPTAADGTVDTSQMPNALISRVDVVTGGASATYGSDAVAGVVNYVLNTKLTGLKGGIEGGLSGVGDVPEWQGNLAGGFGFGPEDRGHFLFSVEGYSSQGIQRFDRSFASAGYAIITNPCPNTVAVSAACPKGGNGQPINLRVANATITTASNAGLIINGPLIGTTFDPNGQARPFQYGTLVTNTGTMVGGEGNRSSLGLGSSIVGSLARANMFTRTSFDITDDINAFVEASYAMSDNKNNSGIPFAVGTSNSFKVTSDNAYLPASIKAAMTAQKLATVAVGKLFSEFPNRPPVTDDTTWRLMGGVDFDILGWKTEAYFQHGFNTRRQSQPGQMDQIEMYQAADAVVVPAGTAGLVAGTIACRTTLTAPTNGCIPLDIFGQGAASPQAINWLTSTNNGQGPVNFLTYTQDVGSVSASGKIIDLWAGPIVGAIGGEYRKEGLNFTSDPYSQVANPISGGFGGWLAGSQLPFNGSYNVKEGFVELDAPIAHDMFLVQDASINAAMRVTDYSLSGSVTTWKIGALYNPIESLRFRYTRSRDIRAPTLTQLFQAGSSGTTNLVDEAPGLVGTTAAGVKTITTGNPALKPEVANTEVYGVVYSPEFIDGLSVSLDHYSILIANAIATVGSQQLINGCYGVGVAVNATFCSHIIRTNGGITAVVASPVNATNLIVSGLDLEASYNQQLPSWFPGFGDGDFRFRNLFGYTDHNISTVPGGAPSDSAPGPNRWKSLTSVSFSKDNLTYNFQMRGISKGLLIVSDVEGGTGANGINDNHVPGMVYFDTNIHYHFDMAGGGWETYFAVDNLLDKSPPIAPGTIGSEANFTNNGLYDVVGRYFRVGLNFKY